MILLRNSQTGKLEPLKTIVEGKVGMYSCGPTVYNLMHIGNARARITSDLIFRYLQFRGYQVTFVQNFTDVDDKIIEQAKAMGISSEAVAAKYCQEAELDYRSMGVIPPTFQPKATEHIPEMIALIEAMIDKGHAYVSNGEVLFAVQTLPQYGKLSGKSLDDQRSGARVEVATYKRHPADFSLWKPAKPGEPFWDSPWGQGRPGWHIECSAMAMKYLGPTLDIHHGGMDLMFPHHENEIAQSESVTGMPFCHCWVHNGFLNINKEKMSKSLGNVVLARDFLTLYGGDILRAMLFNLHYHAPLDLDEGTISAAQGFCDRLYQLKFLAESSVGLAGKPPPELLERVATFAAFFVDHMDNDLATSAVLAEVMSIVRLCNGLADQGRGPMKGKIPGPLAIAVLEMLNPIQQVLGLGTLSESEFTLQKKQRWSLKTGKTTDMVNNLIQERQQARLEKNFTRADEIRLELQAWGVSIKDSPEGTFWIPS